MKSRLSQHLEQLESAVSEWLEYTFYEQAHPDMQRKMRKAAMIPSGSNVNQPPVYRLWRSCQSANCLWWDGGIANQPVVLMMEFAVCRKVTAEHSGYVTSVLNIVG